MGFDSEKGFSSVGVDPSWQKLLEQLSAKGFSRSDLENNEDFIKDFVNEAGGIDNVSPFIHAYLKKLKELIPDCSSEEISTSACAY